jgi:hypothetical protein
MHWIQHPPEPTELLLAWQAPPSVPDRLRWAVGRLQRHGDDAVFDYLGGEEFQLLNLGREPEALRDAGFVGYPAFEIRKRPKGGFRDHVLEAFMRRLPPATRPDFRDYLAHFHIPSTTTLSPFSLLAATEARLPSDGFSLVDPLDATALCVDLVFEIAGFRVHWKSDLRTGDALDFEPEPTNPVDPYAIQVKAADQVIGYVNRLQAVTICKWLEHRRVASWVARLNGRPGLPRAYAFLQVRPAQYCVAA